MYRVVLVIEANFARHIRQPDKDDRTRGRKRMLGYTWCSEPDYLDMVVRGEVGQSNQDRYDSPAMSAYRVDNEIVNTGFDC